MKVRDSIESALSLPLIRHWVGFWAAAAGLALLHASLHRLLAYVLLQSEAMVVMSCAPFALALGGGLLARPDRRPKGVPLSLARLALLTEMSVLGCLVLASRLFVPGVFELRPAAQLPLLVYGLLMLLPFIASGRLLTAPVAQDPAEGAVLVSAGFIGVCVGSLLAEPLIRGAGAPGAVALSAGFFALSTAAWTRRGNRARAAVLSFSIALAAFGLTGFAEYPVARGKAVFSMVRTERADLAYHRWTPVERIDVLRFDPPRTRGGWASLGAGRGAQGQVPGHYFVARDGDLFAAIYEWDGRRASLDFLHHHLLAIPYQLLFQPKVLVLQGVGGVDVLAGLAHDAESVRLSISNPVLREVGQEVFRDFNGDVLHHRGVQTVVTGGRALLRRPATYDLIALHWDHTAVPLGLGMLGLSENQLNTREALATYLSRLRGNGLLAISLVDRGREDDDGHHLRLLRTVYQVLQSFEVREPKEHVLVGASAGSPRLLQLVVRLTPFSPEERERVATFARQEGFEFAVGGRAPHVLAGELSTADLVRAHRWPVATDDSPFFFDLDFVSRALEVDTYRALRQPRQSGLSLPALIASVWIGVVNALLVAVWVLFRVMVDRRVPEIVSPLGSLRGCAWLFFFSVQGVAFACFLLGVLQPLATASGDMQVALGRLLPAMALGCGMGVLLRAQRGFLLSWARILVMIALWITLSLGYTSWFERFGPEEVASMSAIVTGLLLGGFLPFGLQNLVRDVRWVPPAVAAAFWGLGIGHSLGVLWGARVGFSSLPQVGLVLCVLSMAAVHGTHWWVFVRRRRMGLRDSTFGPSPEIERNDG